VIAPRDGRDWAEAYAELSDADASALGAADLEQLAAAAYLLGHVDVSLDAWQRAYQRHLESGDAHHAIRCAFWSIFELITKRDVGPAQGWMARADRVVDELDEECAAHGYILLPRAFQQAAIVKDFVGGRDTAARAAELGRRYGESDLVALALNIEGRCLLGDGRVSEGLSALDEAMVAVIAGELSAMASGVIYCSVIEACDEISELRRAHEWTAALTGWCDRQHGAVTFTGQCLVHRAAIRQLHGEWDEARDELERARELFAVSADSYASGAAWYRLGEVARCRGESEVALEAFREAGEWGHDPQPGLALLWFEQGKIDSAVAAISRALDEADEPSRRLKLLPAHVEVVLASGDAVAARRSAEELAELADRYGTTALAAAAAHALGAVLLADGDAHAALSELRNAVRAWRELSAPFDAARTRVLIAVACRSVGDEETAGLEVSAARQAFARLGAGPELVRTESLLTTRPSAGGLTARELQVLRLLAKGMTNRSIADELVLAVKTVDRHVSNILSKLGVSSRSAATAYAYEHDLI